MEDIDALELVGWGSLQPPTASPVEQRTAQRRLSTSHPYPLRNRSTSPERPPLGGPSQQFRISDSGVDLLELDESLDVESVPHQNKRELPMHNHLSAQAKRRLCLPSPIPSAGTCAAAPRPATAAASDSQPLSRGSFQDSHDQVSSQREPTGPQRLLSQVLKLIRLLFGCMTEAPGPDKTAIAGQTD